MDPDQNPYVLFVHTNGLHSLPYIQCGCGGPQERIAGAVRMRLMPASFTIFKTMFTFDVLEDFRLANLECKTSAYQYYQLLSRKTEPLAPQVVVERYVELWRLSRCWRWPKKLKWGGQNKTRESDGNTIGEVRTAELTPFCPCCLQPGVNLPDNWKEDENKWVYHRTPMANGNFKADHIRQSTGDKDVWLSPGSSMLPHREEYAEFLQAAENIKTKAPCENSFRAIENTLLYAKTCDINGIVAIACPRHGCFTPGGVTNLYRGKQQKNVDWVLPQSLKYSNMDPEQGLLFFYDIACQYSVHFQRRIGHWLPVGLDTDFAIGQFHVHGHKENCLFRFSSMFIPQSGVIIGEILKSLWANLNAVTPAMRTATLAHQAEMLDNHICDSNHKKALNIVRMLCKRYVLADKRAADAEDTRDEIAERVGAKNIAAWTDAVVEAENTRYIDLSVMDIYGMSASYEDHLAVPAEDEPLNGEYQWIREAIEVQELQWHVLCRAKRALKNGQANEARQIANLREKISKGISDIALQSRVLGIDGSDIRNVDPPASLTGTELLPGDTLFSNLNDFEPPDNDIDVDDEESSDKADVPMVLTAAIASPPLAKHPTTASLSHTSAHLHAENIIIPLPSTVPQCAAQLRSHELGLRERQADVLLKSLREIIAEKSMLYSHTLCGAGRQLIKTRSRDRINTLNKKRSDLVYAYARCQHAMMTLKADDTTLRKFKELSKADIKSNTYVVNPNQPGSTTLNLSWIWHVGRDDESAPAALQESNRVLYLKSRALASCWREELLLVKYEMEWTVRYFKHNHDIWVDQSSNSSPGAKAYAQRKAAQYLRQAQVAEGEFIKYN
ncbi:hypothetical protein BDN71DRAFT_1592744 [Pleurotus eryngii]|uniref:CxC2-like cysteine cluster KDZ transposase-associated domain-containing protein n=1 Tax=Pleurotus eryngii TaxID=5323 RepID=A0A9P5ZNI5_PLEER|nr:hypothetical protein BDN71DRAFT_1592744 [Pleurotus eryngii]